MSEWTNFAKALRRRGFPTDELAALAASIDAPVKNGTALTELSDSVAVTPGGGGQVELAWTTGELWRGSGQGAVDPDTYEEVATEEPDAGDADVLIIRQGLYLASVFVEFDTPAEGTTGYVQAGFLYEYDNGNVIRLGGIQAAPPGGPITLFEQFVNVSEDGVKLRATVRSEASENISVAGATLWVSLLQPW